MAFLYSGSLWSSLYCGVSSLWVGLYRWLVKVSWLGKPVWCSGGWIWISSLWSAMKCPVMSYEISMVFGVTLGSLYIGAQGCVPVLLEKLHGMSYSGTCWPLGGAWFQCRYGGVWCAPVDECSLESGVLWCSQDLDLSLLLLVFSLIFTVVSRLLHLYSTFDKTSMLKMKSFFTFRDPQRGL